MPAVSKNQRIAISIAEHHPDQLYKRNEGLKSMSKSDMHDFASTPEKGLPQVKGKFRKKGKGGLNNLPSTSSGDNIGLKDTSSDDKY